ncbi:MAG: anhydro-N-acetylmuramic acid kinase [Gemmatimonadetes bacterium]|nr:anhydro-N-acetylmuramic acid kinase [Gemmatimonadota bacterium]
MLSGFQNAQDRRIIGLMSGTSADGIDAALIHLREKDDGLFLDVLGFDTVAFPPGLRDRVMEVSDPDTGRIDELGRLHFELGELFARAAISAAESTGLSMAEIDLIGSHGQTVHHLPERSARFGVETGATLQIGDPSVIAQRTGVVTVGDFRAADVARGGQGAPLVPYVDYLLFRHPVKARGLLNLGGIANLTVLPAGSKPEEVMAFDTGPANMLIDAVALSETGQAMDPDGAGARRGKPSENLVTGALSMPYFERPPPKSTGRELFGVRCAEVLVREGREAGLNAEDLLATATEITIRSIKDACRRFVEPVVTRMDEMIVSGGGAKNAFLLERLARVLSPVAVSTSDDHGLSSDAKEAVAFAILAHQTVRARPGSLPGATGADRPAVLGKICLPG